MVGLPGSGKTTFCKQFKDYKYSGFNVVHICFDELFPWTKDGSFKHDRKGFLEFVESSISKSEPKTVILLDDNNYFQSMRYKQIQLCRKMKCSFGVLYFPLTLEDAFERNEIRQENALPKNVIRKMFSDLEEPLNCFKFDKNSKFCAVIEYIEDKFRNPFKPIEYSQKNPMTQSQIHIFDLHLRKLISEEMKKVENNKKEEAGKFNFRRKHILQSLRTEELVINSLEELEFYFRN